MSKTGHFNVAPRYTPGSPALVNEATALKVALEERRSIEHVVEGSWGSDHKARAGRLGLRGIVEYRVERGSGKKLGWEVLDVITGEKFFRLCADALHKLGWKHYPELDNWEKAIVDAWESDLAEPMKGHYKLAPAGGRLDVWPTGYKVQVYKPELLNTNIWPWLALRPKEDEVAL